MGYRARLVREGMELEAEGDRAFVVEMIAQFVPRKTANPADKVLKSVGAGAAKPGTDKTLSAREFLGKVRF